MQKQLIAFLALTFLAVASNCYAQETKPPLVPAEKLAEGWERIDDRLIFLMVRLASTETSLEAIDKALVASSRGQSRKNAQVRQAENRNEDMDRKGGGPLQWSLFYGRTAESFLYHPTDRNSTYHTTTILSQQAPANDNQAGPGVPSRQGLPAHQRPPQFDYIYRANESAKARAEKEIAAMVGKTEELTERKNRLEAEQAGLWCDIAFRSVSHYDLDKKPLYRFEPLLKATTDTDARVQFETLRSAASFMALALSIVDAAQKDQPSTFSKIKPAVAMARQNLNDVWLRIGVDVTDKRTAEGKFNALAKRLEESASNLSDSYVVAIEGNLANDQQRKDTFRGLLQESLIRYAEIILALDEMATLMKDDWKVKPDIDKPIQFLSLANVEAIGVSPLPKKENPPTERKRPKKENAKVFQQQFQFAVEKNIKADWKLNAEDRLWSIENKSLKFYVPAEFPGANLVLRHKLDGDIYIEVYGRQNGGSHLWLHLFGEKISLTGEGPFKVQIVRKGNMIQYNIKGVQSSITIKDSVSELPTGFSISWGLDHNGGGTAWISGVVVQATKADKNDE